jgi:hypothetical protein
MMSQTPTPLLKKLMPPPPLPPPGTQAQSQHLPAVRPLLTSAASQLAQQFQMSLPAIAVEAAGHKRLQTQKLKKGLGILASSTPPSQHKRLQTQTPKKGLGISASSTPLLSLGFGQLAQLVELRLQLACSTHRA